MKLPSVDQVFKNALHTFLRFPLVLCSAVIGTSAAVILVDYEGPEGPTILFPILFASILGLPLLLGLALFSEKRSLGQLKALLLQVAGIALLIGYACTVPVTLSSGPLFHIFRLMGFLFATIMLISVAPFFRSDEYDGFWHYNQKLFFRILGSAIFSHILFLGLCLALAAIDALFSIDIAPKRYGEVWIIIFGILNTGLFLAGIPEHLKDFEQESEYPKSLRILVQYALAPLAVIYLIIAYAFVIKIGVTWEWTEGWIGKLIIGFSVTGITSLLVMYPIRDRAEAGWVKSASRWFFIVLIPLAIVYPLAVWRRISEFGITETRYIALAYAAWLIILALYFLLSKSKSIKFIPVSLGIGALAICVGPWGMFPVSEQSQIERLQTALEKNSILVDGKIQKAAVPVKYADSKNISSILEYLHEHHGLDNIQPWFAESLREDSTGTTRAWKSASTVAGIMGIEYVRIWMEGGGSLKTYSLKQDIVLDVKGYDRMYRFQYVNRGGLKKEIAGEGIKFEWSTTLDTLIITRYDSITSTGPLLITFHSLASVLLKDYANESVGNVPPEKMTVSGTSPHLSAKVFVRNIQARVKGDSAEVNTISVDIYFSK
ncbi:MAG: DUF4153 domain-containing protein [Bacteroidota bacterium]